MSEVCELLRETLVTLFTNLTFTASSSGMSGFSNITTHTHTHTNDVLPLTGGLWS